MATTTTNFGWDIPQSTDLVKDGATAIAALGQDIDTALVDLKGGTTGQVLAKASGTDLDFSWVAQDDSNAIQNSIVDAKGDLIAATANDTPARLAVGTNGHVLTADSTTATGLKWAAVAASGGMTLINTGGTALTGASVTIGSIPQTYKDLYLLVVNFGSANINAGLRCRINSDANSRYSFIVNSGTQTFGQTSLHLTGGNAVTPTQGISTTVFPNYTNTTSWKMQISNTMTNDATTSTSVVVTTGVGAYNQTVAITSLDLLPFNGNFTNGTAYLYGVN